MNIKFNENIEDDVLTNATDIENMEIKFTEKAPVRKFNEQTGCLEYKDEELRNKVKQRKKQQSCNDTLRQRLNGLKNT